MGGEQLRVAVCVLLGHYQHGRGCIPPCRWAGATAFFPCAGSFCFTSPVVFIPSHKFSHFYLSDSLPHPTMAGWCWATCQVKPRQFCKSYQDTTKMRLVLFWNSKYLQSFCCLSSFLLKNGKGIHSHACTGLQETVIPSIQLQQAHAVVQTMQQPLNMLLSSFHHSENYSPVNVN